MNDDRHAVRLAAALAAEMERLDVSEIIADIDALTVTRLLADLAIINIARLRFVRQIMLSNAPELRPVLAALNDQPQQSPRVLH